MVRLRHILTVLTVVYVFTACQHDITSDDKLTVTLDESNTYLAGEPVVFNIHGEPDNILFYSGEPESIYGEEGTRPNVIKNIQNYMHTYEYTYEEPGTYLATFFASNATYVHDYQCTFTVSVTVIENLNSEK